MNADAQNQLIENAIRKLGLKLSLKQRKMITDLFVEEGADASKWSRSVSKVANIPLMDRKDPLRALIDTYRELMQFKNDIECDYCRRTGWLKVILISGRYASGAKVWMFNFNVQDGHLKFLNKNRTFRASAHQMPCVCENGGAKNTILEHEWLKPEHRSKVLQRSVKYSHSSEDENEAYEDYMLEQTVYKINKIREGIDYQIKPIHEYPNVEELQNQLRTTLEEIK